MTQLTPEHFRTFIEESKGKWAIVICGPSASGKSTIEATIRAWASAYKEEMGSQDCASISNDNTKGMGEGKQAMRLHFVSQAISNNQPVIFNTRGNKPDDVTSVRDYLKQSEYRVMALLPCASTELVKERMRARDEGKVDEIQIEKRCEEGKVALWHMYKERYRYDEVFFVNNEQARTKVEQEKGAPLPVLARCTKGEQHVYAETQFSNFITMIVEQRAEKTAVEVSAARL